MSIYDIKPEEGGGVELWNFGFRPIIDMVDDPKII
jgi:hypothetical protein